MTHSRMRLSVCAHAARALPRARALPHLQVRRQRGRRRRRELVERHAQVGLHLRVQPQLRALARAALVRQQHAQLPQLLQHRGL